jgi:hypothetical protein
MDFSIADPIVSQRSKFAVLFSSTKQRVSFMSDGACPVPYRTVHNPDGGRPSVTLIATEEMQNFFQRFDEWAVEYLTENSERLFGKVLTKDVVVSGYRPTIITKEIGCLVGAKISTAGAHTTKYWTDVDFRERPPLDEFKGASLKCKLLISHLWIAGPHSFGFVIIATDIVVVSEAGLAERSCPFS